MEQKFYLCKHCGNIITKIKDIGVPVICCDEPMSEIVPGTTDAAVEKHVPVWTVENDIVHVKVGSVEHPMLPEHYIEWVFSGKRANRRICMFSPMDMTFSCMISVTVSSELG